MKSFITRTSVFWLPVLLPLVLFAPLLLTGRALFWGTVSLQFIPWRVLAAEIIKSGQLPLWNPLVGMGAPLLANYQSGLLYPPNWIVLLGAAFGGAGEAARLQTWIAALHLGWGGLGMALLARKLGFARLTQTVCGMAFALSGYCVSRTGFLSINSTVAWFPWVVLAVSNLRGEAVPFSRFARLTLILALMLLAGHAQTAWYIILYTLAWVAFLGWMQAPALGSSVKNERRGRRLVIRARQVLRQWFWLGMAFGGALLLAAIQLLPTMELLLQSQRANAVEYDFAMTYSYWPWRLVTLLSPQFFGSPASGDYWGYGYYWEDAVYIGVLPMLFVLGAFGTLIPRRRNENSAEGNSPGRVLGIHSRSMIAFLAGMIFMSFFLAFGKNTPVFPWLYDNVPTFDMFQAPTRFSIWAQFSLVLLAGIGFERLSRPQGRALYWARLGTAGAGAITLGTGLAWIILGDVSPTFLRGMAWFSAFALATGLLVLAVPPVKETWRKASLQSTLWQSCLMLVVGIDLTWSSWGLNPGIGIEFYQGESASARRVQQLSGSQRLYLDQDDEYELKYHRFFRSDTFTIAEDWRQVRTVLLPGIHILDGITSANNYDPLLPSRYVQWMARLKQLAKTDNSSRYWLALNLMGVGVVEMLDPSTSSGVSFQPVRDSRRIRLVPCAQFARNAEEAWTLLADASFNPDHVVILEGSSNIPGSACEEKDSIGDVRLVVDQANRIVMHAKTTHDGWLVLSDVWYPGWTAEVDGESTPILRANYLFRAIQLTPGEHVIVWRYNPISFWIGAGVSLVGWICLLVFWRLKSKKPA